MLKRISKMMTSL